MLERITARGGPAPLGPYSHAVRAGDLVFVSGQAALNPETNQLEAGTAAAQTRRVLENIRIVLQAAGADLSDVVKCCVFLADIQEFSEMNRVYAECFGESKPARTTAEVGLPHKDMKVLIDCVAYKPMS